MILFKAFEHKEQDLFIQPYTAFGSCDEYVYLKKGKDFFKYNVFNDKYINTDLPYASHYHLNGKVYSTVHKWIDLFPRSFFYIDGEEVAKHEYPVGNDRTLYHNGLRWYMYIRSHPHTEMKISLQVSDDFIEWSSMLPVEHKGIMQNERVYSFCPFEWKNKLYGIGNIYVTGDSPYPYSNNEHNIYPALFKAVDNNIFEWNFLKDLSFISRKNQLFVTPFVREDLLILTTIESYRKHTTYCNIHESHKPYSSKIYFVEPDKIIE